MGHYQDSVINNSTTCLGGVAQWTECLPVNQKVASSIPSQGTCLGCRSDSPVEGALEVNTLMFLSLSPSCPLSKKINKYNL